MLYRICKLHFTTPVRFGSDDGGDSYTGVRMNAHADTLFSAMYISMLATGEAEALRKKVEEGCLQFSDTFPYSRDVLYIPRPMGIAATEQKALDPAQRKLFKKLDYVPFDSIKEFFSGNADPHKLKGDFGVAFDSHRVNLRDFDESRPYSVSGYRFNEECGLYTVVRAEDEEALKLFVTGMSMLSADGFGGRSSSGWGKFEYSVEEPSDAFRAALSDTKSENQMLLSCALPGEAEAETAMNGARYMLVRRGGFNSGASAPVYKRRTVYLLSAGSVFKKRFNGILIDTANAETHPVWRYARGMFMGVGV